VLSIGTHVIPHPRNVETGGEDAFFVGDDGGGVFAIADGVSGWAEKNVNPALFSRELMANSSTFLKDEEVSHDPQILLMKAHAATSSTGSATAIIAMLEKTGTLKIASVGDCGLKVIRKGQVMFSTCPQEHYFDCPYQLSSEAIGQTYKDALVCTVHLMEGDIIVSGSDGFFDNIFDQEILAVISESPGIDESAKALAELARKHSVDVRFDSPYSMEARSRGFDVPWWKKLLGAKLTGGKMDDITVIVAQVNIVVIPDDEGAIVEREKGAEKVTVAATATASAEQKG
jgi:protein phosphatase PTC7